MSEKNKEIERKWNLPNINTRNHLATIRDLAVKTTVISQGYIVVTPDTEVRVRKKVKDDGTVSYVETVKTGDGLVRGEVEISLTADQFGKLWRLTEGRRVEKTRYAIPCGMEENPNVVLMAEVDVYSGALSGHCTVEVEFPDERSAAAFTLGNLFGVARDVTTDKRFKNQQLAVDGWPKD